MGGRMEGQGRVVTPQALYAENAPAMRERLTALGGELRRRFGAESARFFSAPGRAEIGGNHTDHQHGRVVAAAVGLDAVAAAAKNDSVCVRIASHGFAPISLSLDVLAARQDERGTPAAFVRGVAEALSEAGYAVGGFDACIDSAVPAGASLSSSACFAVLIGAVLNGLYNGGEIAPEALALAAKHAENAHFGKPCGLMDQLACAVGGFIAVDFENEAEPAAQKLSFDLAQSGYALCILNTGGSHAGLTDQYAAIPAEMSAVAAMFGKRFLREVPAADFFAQIGAIRGQVPDRALLRAMHFFEEDRRAAEEADALRQGDFARFLALADASGRSSEALLENICPADPNERSLALGIAWARRLLCGRGVCRVQGGGFAGTAEAFVPLGSLEAFRKDFEALFGAGSVLVLPVRQQGAVEIAFEGSKEI